MFELLGDPWDAPAVRWLGARARGDHAAAVELALQFDSAANMREVLGEPCAA